jgi:hypothetical protein
MTRDLMTATAVGCIAAVAVGQSAPAGSAF